MRPGAGKRETTIWVLEEGGVHPPLKDGSSLPARPGPLAASGSVWWFPFRAAGAPYWSIQLRGFITFASSRGVLVTQNDILVDQDVVLVDQNVVLVDQVAGQAQVAGPGWLARGRNKAGGPY